MSNLTPDASAPTIHATTNQKMSSLDVADLTGKNHFDVLRDVRSLIGQGAINGSNFAAVEYKDKKNEMRPMYQLDFQATMVLITGYDAKRRSQVIARWIELENGASSSAKKNPILALESEIKEGASLLAAVIGQETLPDEHKWQLVDRLFTELFGSGVEILNGKTALHAQAKCNGPDFYHVDSNAPLLTLSRGLEVGVYHVELSQLCIHWFIEKQCLVDQKAAVSQQVLYRSFVEWFVYAFSAQAPEFTIFHDAMIRRFNTITLVGEPWFVGIALDKEVKV